jgi:curved DNA-binding protein CbpA
MKNTLYAILGIDDKATLEVIAAAYRVREKRLRYAGDHDSQNELKLVQHAFEILSDPEQREKYDQRLKAEKTLSNTVIYYSSESRQGSHGALKLIVVFALVIVGFMIYQNHFQKHSWVAASSGSMTADSGLSLSPAAHEVRAASIPPDDMPRQQPGRPVPTPQPAVQPQTVRPNANAEASTAAEQANLQVKP